MPRRNPRPEPARPERPIGSAQQSEQHADGDWNVRRLTGASSSKAYRCPGCEHEIPAGSGHVVAWPADGDGTDRRHWHTACWAARSRRPPPRPTRR